MPNLSQEPMMVELKPCPFCGGKAGIGSDDAYDDVTWQAYCKQCHATIERDVKDHAVLLWNTRAILSTGDDAGLARELRDLAIVLHRKHYPEVVQWEPLDDPRGILSQIDNMTAGLVRANLSDAGPVEEWRDKLAELHEWTGREDVGENSELYGFLCSLIGYLVTGEEQAAAILSLTARNKALEELALLVSEESIEAMADDIACAVVEPRADVVAMRRSAMIRLGERLRAPLSTDLKRIAALNHQDNRQKEGGE